MNARKRGLSQEMTARETVSSYSFSTASGSFPAAPSSPAMRSSS